MSHDNLFHRAYIRVSELTPVVTAQLLYFLEQDSPYLQCVYGLFFGREFRGVVSQVLEHVDRGQVVVDVFPVVGRVLEDR